MQSTNKEGKECVRKGKKEDELWAIGASVTLTVMPPSGSGIKGTARTMMRVRSAPEFPPLWSRNNKGPHPAGSPWGCVSPGHCQPSVSVAVITFIVFWQSQWRLFFDLGRYKVLAQVQGKKILSYCLGENINRPANFLGKSNNIPCDAAHAPYTGQFHVGASPGDAATSLHGGVCHRGRAGPEGILNAHQHGNDHVKLGAFLPGRP